jgi:flagellar assembly protein FliH
MSDRHAHFYDGQGHWRRWEMDSLERESAEERALHTAAEPAEPEHPALPDPAEVLAEIERLRETAIARGQAEGFAAGHNQGLEAGVKEGREAGFQEGRDAGFAEGHAHGMEAAREETEKLRLLVQNCADALANIEAETGEALVGLALSVARQVIRSTIKAEPERILDLIREVVQLDGASQGILKIRLNPADIELVEQFLERDPTVSHWRLQADMGIDRGGCIVETGLGNIDATLQTRWQRVASTLGAKP